MQRAKPQHDWEKARRLRKELSLPEALLWRLLKGEPQGVKFRRQHPVGPYVIDFYNPATRLGFEIDGVAHDMGDRPERNLKRDLWLAERGIAVIRIPASEVLRSASDVAEAMVAECRKRM